MNQHLINTLLVLGGMLTGAVTVYLGYIAGKKKPGLTYSDGLVQGFKTSEDGHTKNGYMAATQDVMEALDHQRNKTFSVGELLGDLTRKRNERRTTGIWGAKETRRYHA